ncbi:hypothetical protein HMPREF0352_2357 [Enterococcus faecium TX1330]|nr:hypothetical protein HMPREF0352_2357 [Enterococcus faecium TX1330]
MSHALCLSQHMVEILITVVSSLFRVNDVTCSYTSGLSFLDTQCSISSPSILD